MNSDFPHAINSIGHEGCAPLFIVGGKITNADFMVTDFAGIQGVVITSRGLPEGTKWKDLNLRFLFEKVSHIRYLDLFFQGPADLAHLGLQGELFALYADCPKAVPGAECVLNAEKARVRWPDACNRMLGKKLRSLELIRTKIRSLADLDVYEHLEELHIHLSQSITSLDGIERFPALKALHLHDCPRLIRPGIRQRSRGPTEISFWGCKRMESLEGLEVLEQLTTVRVVGGPASVFVPPALLKVRGLEVELKGVKQK